MNTFSGLFFSHLQKSNKVIQLEQAINAPENIPSQKQHQKKIYLLIQQERVYIKISASYKINKSTSMNDDDFEVLFTSEDYKKLEDKVRKYEKQLISSDREKEKLTEKIFILTGQNTKQQKEMTQLNQKIKYLSEEGLKMSKILLDAENSNHQLKVSIAQTEKSLAKKNLELIKEKQQIEMKFQEALVELEQQKKEVLNLKQQLQENKRKYFINSFIQTDLTHSQITKERQQKEILFDDLKKVTKENQMLKKKFKEIEEEIKIKTDQIKRVSDKYEGKIEKIMQQKSRLIQEMQKEIIQNKHKIELQLQQLNASSQAINELYQQIQQHKVENQQLQKKLKNQELEKQYFKEKLSQLQAELNENSSDKLSWSEKEKLLKQQNANLKGLLVKEKATSQQMFDKLSQKLRNMEQEQEKMNKKIVKYTQRCGEMEQALLEFKAERDKTEKEYEDIIHDLEYKLEKKVSNKSIQLQELRKDIESYFEYIMLGLMDIGGLDEKQIKDLLSDNKKILEATVTEVFNEYEKMIGQNK